MTDVRQWLEELGLAQYADAFESEDIDLAALRRLSENDLKELGLTMGPRRKVQTAIAEMGMEESAPKPEDSGQPDEQSHVAERRQITVMFCDLVGSTALSEQLDPEDLRDLMRAYQHVCGAIIEQYGGHVAQYLGDGLMNYFGWPRAHEDDAERAVRAGLDIVSAVKAVEATEPLSVRIGIATGPVVVGETGAGDASVPKLAVGETPNRAARVQSLARPDHVLIGPTTHRLVAGAFDYDDLGDHALKGIVEPVRVHRVLGAAAAETRFEAGRGGGDLTPLVGRAEEIGLLLRRWAQATDGDGQIVLLNGEPGIGKSRITRELVEQVKSEPHTRLRYQCSPYFANSTFYPIIAQFERTAGFAGDDAEANLDKMEAWLGQWADDVAAVAPLFAAVLSLPTSRYPPLNLDPQEQKELTLAAFAAQVTGLARHRPVLFEFEDAHWADPSTLEALDAVVPAIQNSAVLMVVTYRPEFEPPWTSQGHVTQFSLTRLGRRDGAAMVARVTGGKALPDEVLDKIVAKTDGVPLFVEELTKSVLEADFLTEGGDGYELTGALPDLAIPATVQDALTARLDRLATVKETAQIGAAIGREFSHELMAAVTPLSANELRDALDRLFQSGLIFRRGSSSNSTYMFKHALVQDTAYHGLLKSKRREIHGKIAQALEEKFPQTAATQPELVAHHFTEAGRAERAVAFWHRAGQRAAERSANREAVGHLTRGLDILSKMPAAPGRARQELTLQIALGAPTQALKGQAASETAAVFRRARELCEPMGDPRQLSTVLHGLHAFHIVRGELPAAMDLAEECHRIAQRGEDRALFAPAHFVTGCVSFHLGNLTSARDDFEKAVRLYDPSPRAPRVLPAGLDLGVFGKSYLSHAFWYLGYLNRAAEWSQAAAAEAAERSHFFSQAVAAAYAAMLMQYLGDTRAAKQRAEAAAALCTEHKFAYYLAWAAVIRGWALAKEGREDDGIMEMREGLAAMRATGAGLRRPYYLGILAETLGAAGRIDEASDLVASALAVAAEHGEQFYSGELYRIEGELLRRRSEPEASESSFRRALAIARSQDARSTELRVATGLARLWCEQGKAQDACGLLAPVYGWFAEGFDTADLKDAKSLLGSIN